DARWVQCWALIRGVAARGGYTLIALKARNGTATALIPGQEHAAHFQKLVNSSVRVRGVCVPSFNERRIVSKPPMIYAQRPESIVVLERAEVGPGQTTAPLLEHLYRFSPDPHPGLRWVKVAGVVTGMGPGSEFYIQDSSAQ